jgi:hypothetical protein
VVAGPVVVVVAVIDVVVRREAEQAQRELEDEDGAADGGADQEYGFHG